MSKHTRRIIGIIVLLLAGTSYGIYYFLPQNSRHTISKAQNNPNPAKKQSDEYPMMGGMPMMSHMNVKSEEQFIRDMIPHHQEAIDSSKEFLARSQNEDLKKLAQGIVDAQSKEIDTMNGWLKEWYPNSTGTSMYKKMMPNLAIVSGMSLDRLYMDGMIRHHGGAIGMAQGVLKLDPREEVKNFANTVIEVQTKEIEEMQAMMNPGMPPQMQRNNMMHR